MPATKRPFELPALAPLNFSLTDGTSIPPPPDSPIEEQAPPSNPEPAQTNALVASHGHAAVQQTQNGHDRGRTTSTDIPPQSPVTSTRPSSIRRFLSRKSLNANYTNGTNHNMSNEDLTGVGRPDSPSSFLDGRPGLKKVKSGSWFKRLGSMNRQSVIYENRPEEKKVVPMGPPPPRLPELNELKARVEENNDLGGEDMFKNIK